MSEMSDLRPALKAIAEGRALTADETRAAFDTLLSGAASEIEIAAFLMGLRARGETPVEIAAAAQAMRARAIRVDAPAGAVDLCGTGGDGADTVNISTAASLIAAGAGAHVAKHGNKAASSRSGSSDVLAALGVNLHAREDQIARAIREAGVGFMFAAYHHGAVKAVAPVRQALGVRTIFNLLGPLSNPAGARHQLIGVFDPAYLVPLAEALKSLGAERAWIVHGNDGLDEITTTDKTHVAELHQGRIRTFEITPEDAGIARAHPRDLKGGTPAENADALRAVLDGQKGAYRDIAIFNAAGALIVAGLAENLEDGVRRAAHAIDSGAARHALQRLVDISNTPPHESLP